MTDPRVKKHAQLLVHYMAVKSGSMGNCFMIPAGFWWFDA